MKDFEFHSPTKVLFEKGAETRMGTEIASKGFHQVLVHFGGTYLAETGVLDRTHQSLTGAGPSYLDLGDIVPNLRLSHVKEGVALCKKKGVDFVLGVGGGSVIDSAKTAVYGPVSEFDLEDLFPGKIKTDKIAPIDCITTIVATGSETSSFTVVTIETREQGILKRSCSHDCARSLFAVMNPEPTYTLPTYQMSNGVADIVVHTMERYITQAKNVKLNGRISEGLLMTVRDTTFKILKNPQDYEARTNLMRAGSLSRNGLTGTDQINDFPIHKLEYELNAMLNATCGASLIATWGNWVRTVYKSNPARFTRFAVEVFGAGLNYDDLEETALTGIDAWDDWYMKVDMPIATTGLLGFTPTEAQINEMAEKAAAIGGGVIGLFHWLDK